MKKSGERGAFSISITKKMQKVQTRWFRRLEREKAWVENSIRSERATMNRAGKGTRKTKKTMDGLLKGKHTGTKLDEGKGPKLDPVENKDPGSRRFPGEKRTKIGSGGEQISR